MPFNILFVLGLKAKRSETSSYAFELFCSGGWERGLLSLVLRLIVAYWTLLETESAMRIFFVLINAEFRKRFEFLIGQSWWIRGKYQGFCVGYVEGSCSVLGFSGPLSLFWSSLRVLTSFQRGIGEGWGSSMWFPCCAYWLLCNFLSILCRGRGGGSGFRR